MSSGESPDVADPTSVADTEAGRVDTDTVDDSTVVACVDTSEVTSYVLLTTVGVAAVVDVDSLVFVASKADDIVDGDTVPTVEPPDVVDDSVAVWNRDVTADEMSTVDDSDVVFSSDVIDCGAVVFLVVDD